MQEDKPMFNLTLFSGQNVAVDGKKVVRLRPGLLHYDPPGTNSQVNWSTTSNVRDTTASVASLVQAEQGPSFTSLHSPEFGEVWFDAKKATGPLYVAPVDRWKGVQSSLEVGGKRQYVTETPQEVYNLIQHCGGTTVPIVDITSTFVPDDQLAIPEMEVWDDEYLFRDQRDRKR